MLLQTLQLAKAILSKLKLTQEPLVDNSLIQYDTEDIQKGATVFLCEGASDWSVLPDGKFQTKSGIQFIVEAGTVSSVDKTGYVAPPAQADPLPQGINASAAEEPTTEKHEMNTLVNPPAAGAPDSLVDPNLINADDSYSTCMQKLNELHAQHGHLQGQHDKLRGEHDAANAKMNQLIDKHNALAVKCDDMAKLLKAASDDKILMSRQIEILSKQPAAEAVEEVKGGGFKNVDKNVAKTKAYQMFNED